MSKSDPDSAIFMEDDAANVTRKMSQAYCPLVPEAQENQPQVRTLVLSVACSLATTRTRSCQVLGCLPQ